jgi:hypothetical protein
MSLAWRRLSCRSTPSGARARQAGSRSPSCTAGDVLIAATALRAALLLLGDPGWPGISFACVLTAATAVGLGYTAWSEGRNTAARGSWADAEIMPVLPPFGTGLLPLLQWLLLPPLGLVLARRLAIIQQPPACENPS